MVRTPDDRRRTQTLRLRIELRSDFRPPNFSREEQFDESRDSDDKQEEHQDAPQFHTPHHGSVHCAIVHVAGLMLSSFRDRAKARDKSRNPLHVASIGIAEGLKRLVLLCMCEAHVHPNEQREHGKRQDGGPLQKEPKHHENEADVLRMPDVRIRVTAS